MWIRLPWLGVIDSLLFAGIVGVEGITVGVNQLDVVVELCYQGGSVRVGVKAWETRVVQTPGFESSIHGCGRSSLWMEM